MNFKSFELKKFRKTDGLLIDVRSPEEYYKGHMPNSINIPLFDNEERVILGVTYKNSGREKAVLKGLKITIDKFETLVKNLIFAEKEFSSKNNLSINSKTIRIYCARGGMRSQSINWLLTKFKFNVISLRGGYKSYRKWVLDNFTKNKKIITIGGKTGTGKTNILKELKKESNQSIDLEFLANHRGSSFGGLGMDNQPSNEHFENLIAEELSIYNNKNPIYVESESANIGKCRIPFEFFKQMKDSPMIEIYKTEDHRIEELIKTYSGFSKDDLKESILRIKKRLGPQRTKSALYALEIEDWEAVCKSVLEYYDKCYDYELKNRVNVIKVNSEGKNIKQIVKEIIQVSIKHINNKDNIN